MRVLLTRLSALGDVVHTWPLAAHLARSVRPSGLAWVVEEPFLPLVAGHPAVTHAIPVATRRWRRRPFASSTRREIAAARRLVREFAPDVALDPQGLCKSAAWGLLSGAPRRVGLVPALRRETLAGLCYTETVAPSGVTHVIDVNLSLAGALGAPRADGAMPDGTFLLRAAPPASGPAPAPSPVVLLPGTAGRGKAWPASSFAELARGVAALGTPVTVAWGPGERELAEAIVTGSGGAATLAPATGLVELTMLLARAAVIVGGDTGPVHLAASLAVPTVAVFLVTDPERNGPRGPRVRVVSSARTGARNGRAHSGALGDVGVADVLAAVERSLAEPAPVAR